MRIYRVKAWNDLFESAKSREYNSRSQVYMPNKHGLGFKRILAHERGEAVFGCWCAIVQVISRHAKPRHGYLTDTGGPDGVPLGVDDIALLTGFKIATCQVMLELCASAPVAWLEYSDTCDSHGYHADTSVFPTPHSEGEGEGEGNGEGNGVIVREEGDARGNEYPVAFEAFWKAYPRKIGKKAALKAWSNAKDRPAIETILSAIALQSGSDQWKKDAGQFIPHPSTWLNQGRWHDEVGAGKSIAANYDDASDPLLKFSGKGTVNP